MLKIRRIVRILTVALVGIILSSCTSLHYKSSSIENKVTLKFIQHSYVSDVEGIGYYFENDQLALTILSFETGSYLDAAKVDSLYEDVNYVVPTLVGDGYWRFTFFTKDFEEETGLSCDFLLEQTLNDDMTIHFAIYG